MSHSKATDSYQKRPIRSFVQRTGRITEAQKRAFNVLWQSYGIDYDAQPIDLGLIFGRDTKRTLEIGFGAGTSLVETAARYPETDFLGIEVHEPGVGRCMREAHAAGLTNIKVICHDAIEVLRDQLSDQSIDVVNLFFPDPWHKKRHHKRRIVQAEFVETLSSKLRNGGKFHVATDWPPYAEHIQLIMDEQQQLRRTGSDIPWRPATRFENRGVKLGHSIWEAIFLKA